MDYFVQVCLALKHIHDRKVLHRDIKSQNIFLTKQNMVKLGDFGIAKVLDSTKQQVRTMVGTPQQLSPEIVENKPYSFKSDIRSIGVLLQEMCTLKPPFDAQSLHFLAAKIVQGKQPPIPSMYSQGIRRIVADCLVVNSAKRPKIGEVLKANAIQNRIKTFLTSTQQCNEFDHTAIHSYNLFNIPKN